MLIINNGRWTDGIFLQTDLQDEDSPSEFDDSSSPFTLVVSLALQVPTGMLTDQQQQREDKKRAENVEQGIPPQLRLL